MKKIILFLGLIISTFSYARQNDYVESDRLLDLIYRCESDQYDADCLKRGIHRLIERGSDGGGGVRKNLVCHSNGTHFAVYDEGKSNYLDDYYKKSGSECKQSIQKIRNGLFCSVGSNSKYAVRDLATRNYLSPNYSIPLHECFESIARMRRQYICIAGSNGKYARYNTETKTYLDSSYFMELQDCLDNL